jgi:hypothetical protein
VLFESLDAIPLAAVEEQKSALCQPRPTAPFKRKFAHIVTTDL